MKKLKIFSVFAMVIILALSSSQLSIFAQSKGDNENVKVKAFKTSIDVSWEVPGDNFIITDIGNNDAVVYEGTENQTIVNNLSPESLYRFKLSTYDTNGILLKEYYVSTQTKKNKKNDAQEAANDINLTANVVVSKDKVVLEWDKVPGVAEYKIYKNNEFIDAVKGTKYIDREVMKDTYIPYEVQFEVALSEADKEELKTEFKNLGKEINDKDIERIAYKPYSIIKVVDASIVVPQLKLASVEKSFKWTYKAFIPYDFAEDPWYNARTWGDGIAYFGGDDRGFSSTSEKYRTKTLGDSIFYDGSTSTHEAFYKKVSPTTAYDKNYVFVGSKTDSGANINRIVNSKSSSMVDTTVYHKSGNPYAVPGAEIDYQMRVKTYSNGSYSFEGLHDRAPSHELYLRIDNVTNVSIFRHGHEGFEYLGSSSTLARSFSVSN
ncbi:hypothetical protein VQL36_03155 [Chengkuizengella sp. SCS-71B]|uniref:hypothetical protein n=1 Tax=Chengkuizengella sp. SCS-71B TaxID=3115290 RepID=UPI0032C2178E